MMTSPNYNISSQITQKKIWVYVNTLIWVMLYSETVWDARLPVNQCGAHRDRVLSYQNRTYCFQMRIICFSFWLESFPTDIIQIESLTHNLSDCLGDQDCCT